MMRPSCPFEEPPRDGDEPPNRPAKPSRSPWRDPGSIRGALVVGVASGLILLAGDKVLDHVDIDIDHCSITTTLYDATLTTTWRDNC